MASIFILAPDGSKTLVSKDQLISLAQSGGITPETQLEVLGRVVSAEKVKELKQYFEAKENEKSEQARQPKELGATFSASSDTVANEFLEPANKEDSPSYVSTLETETRQEPPKNPDLSEDVPQLAQLPTNELPNSAESEKSPEPSAEEKLSAELLSEHSEAIEKLVDKLIDLRIPIINNLFGILFVILAIGGVLGLFVGASYENFAMVIGDLILGALAVLTLLSLKEMIYAHLKNQIRQELFLTEIIKELKSKSNN